MIPSCVLQVFSHFYPQHFPQNNHIAYWTLLAPVDHYQANARGDSSHLENLVTACWACNRSKSALTAGRGSHQPYDAAGQQTGGVSMRSAWEFGHGVEGLVFRRRRLIGELPPIVVERLDDDGTWRLVDRRVWDDVTPTAGHVPFAYAPNAVLDGPYIPATRDDRVAWLASAIDATANRVRALVAETTAALEQAAPGTPEFDAALEGPGLAQAAVDALAALQFELFRLQIGGPLD